MIITSKFNINNFSNYPGLTGRKENLMELGEKFPVLNVADFMSAVAYIYND